MSVLRLYKSEKLCSTLEIENLYARGTSIIAYPLRAVWLEVPRDDWRHPVAARFLVSIPKKRIRHAVDRVLLRRRTREAYRLNRRELLTDILQQHGIGVDIAFVYLDSTPAPYAVISDKVTLLLSRIAQAASKPQPPRQENEK